MIVGDVYESGGSFVGGNDLITMVNASAGVISGDAFFLSGGANGNDSISFSWNQVNLAPATGVIVAGDFYTASGGSFVGGNDTIAVNLTVGVVPLGSGFSGASFTGGNDTIVLNFNRFDGFNVLAGDVINASVTGTFRGGNDNLTGSNAADFIYGDGQIVVAAAYTGGNDMLNGYGGNDYLDGGNGFDTVVYSSLNQAVFVNLNGIPASASAPANWVEAIGQGSDQLISIEGSSARNSATSSSATRQPTCSTAAVAPTC